MKGQLIGLTISHGNQKKTNEGLESEFMGT
jgi:hypothetical protein